MPATKSTPEEFLQTVASMRQQNATDAEIASALGVGVRRIYERLARMGLKLADFPKDERAAQAPVASPIRSANMSFEELVEDRKKTYDRKRNHEDDKAALTIRLPIDGPYGVLFFGDPHVDDDGCDWNALHRHIQMVQDTEGLCAANLGDTQNGWVGRLERLYANQRTTAAEALILVEGFIKSLRHKWLFHIGGNHDLWAGRNDPLPAICAAAQATYIPVGGVVAVQQGKHRFDINARHTFPGNSMWNTAHGAARSILMGMDAHLTICGHKHTTGQNVLVSPKGRICHAVQVASYKLIDEYAHEGGFRNNTVSPACLVIVDHRYPDTDPAMVQVFHSVERGVEFLKFLRGEYAKQAPKAGTAKKARV